ncbi:ABC transporter ATP-binding protein [Candidatus Bipolaricaulota bacterium]|nr:ABC transporter ATP-binding protein [Candidatus Bipolaricaulota bacterium]
MEEEEIPVKTRDLTAGYDGNPVINNVNLTVKEDDFMGIIGPNGGGKTTLLKTILGLIRPMRGEVKVFGKPPEETRSRIGYVPQYATFDEDYPITVHEVVQMGRRRDKKFYESYSQMDNRKTREALEAVEMKDYEEEPVSELSGGQKQRVFIARALVSDPEVLMLDEPTASVDRKIEKGIYSLLNQFNEEMAIVVVTHDIGVMSSYVTKVSCLSGELYTSDEPHLGREMLEEAYQCPVELITYAGEEIPHRVLGEHEENPGGNG